jgi:hypothetical protein
MKKVKIYALEKTEAIDYSPIYKIILGQDVLFKKGDILRFDPACKYLGVYDGKDASNA